MNRLRALGKKVLLLAGSLGFCLLVLEIFVRATWQPAWHIPREAVRTPGIFSARMRTDAELDIPLLDGGTFHVTTNARGFRGPLVASIAGKPLSIVSLGDSYTFGWGLALEDQAMSRFVAGYRAAHPALDVGHAYVACPSWDPRDYYFAYLTEAREAKPDLVVVGVFTGNDAMPPDAPRLLDPALAPSVDEVPEPPRPWLRSIGWLGAQLSSNLFAVRVGLVERHELAAFAPFDPDLTQQRRLWDTSFFYLEALNAAVTKDGGSLAIVLYPSPLQVIARERLEKAGYDRRMPEKVFASFCRQHGIDLVTLVDALEANDQRRDLFFPRDRHLTARGSEVAAAALQTKLGGIVSGVWALKQRRAP